MEELGCDCKVSGNVIQGVRFTSIFAAGNTVKPVGALSYVGGKTTTGIPTSATHRLLHKGDDLLTYISPSCVLHQRDCPNGRLLSLAEKNAFRRAHDGRMRGSPSVRNRFPSRI